MKRSEQRILTTHTGSLPRSPALRDLLVSLGCDRIQGYLIGKPVEGSGFLRWMLDCRANVGPGSKRRRPRWSPPKQ